jgi:hypothetical protein
MSFGRLFSSLGCVLMGLGLSIPSLHRLLLKRCVDDAKLISFGALLRHLFVGLLDQSLLTRKHRPHTTLMADEQRFLARPLIELLVTIKTKEKGGVELNKTPRQT